MGKDKEPKIKTESRSFKIEIIMLFLFVLIGAIAILLNYDNWLGMGMLVVGLVSLYFNNVSKWLDLIVALLWSGLYFYFSRLNGYYAQAVLVSLFYLFINIYGVFKKQDLDTIVKVKNTLKSHERIALIFIFACVSVGSYLLLKLLVDEKLIILDILSAILLCCSLYLTIKKSYDYLIVRLIAMISIIVLWALGIYLYGPRPGSASICIMWVAFIIYDNLRITKWAGHETKVKEETIFDSAEYKEAEQRYRKNNKTGLPTKSVGVDKEGKRK